MYRTAGLTILIPLALLASACNLFGSDDVGRQVCRPEDREVLVAEELGVETPSTPFEFAARDDVWVGLITDSDLSSSALFSQAGGFYVIEEGDVVEYTRNDLDFVVTDDPYLDFDSEGQFVPFDFPAGAYQLWSLKALEVAVVVCPSDGS
jgi:hypothetical protein